MNYYKFTAIRLADSWLSPAYVGITADGTIGYLSGTGPTDIEATQVTTVNGAVVPGFQNAHSHAFQYGMVGAAEQHQHGATDDFWSWREAMYQCALRFNPQQVQDVATALYREMLRNGYTHVAEFHYLHHDEQGKPYDNPAEIGERLIHAAATAGIKITLVPVFYQKGNFGQAPQERQRRFISKTTDDYFRLLENSKQATSWYKDARLGYGVHSLRAVDGRDIIETVAQGPQDLPFHLHAAEQLKEIGDSQSYLGKRPVEWLLDNLPLDRRFHVVHCTHMTEEETRLLAQSGANVVLCPGTEGNLGDGIFNLSSYANHGGSWSIGTDSHISLNPLEDLRWLDYAQRLISHKRNTFADGAVTLMDTTLQAGRRAMGTVEKEDFPYFEIGKPFDAAVYDLEHPMLSQAPLRHLLSTIVYAGGTSLLMGTIVNGQWTYQKNRF
ncbi:atrazine chlorohydrolase [Pedobacter sp. BAL39]|uniref:formimidoylglutamate deiminase n=1 Tax=Pedobacter sp. BAL39 TaxID=391596 RepID=UPI0001559838|nr:formimidoylglutamate deiminase [Pedobacter sp. BAL39]EDM36212.1 atrazine chlorohydrolase [Pedobacter sp. BAL39]